MSTAKVTNGQLEVVAALEESKFALETLLANDQTCQAIAQGGAILGETLAAGGKVLSCGNGGSMCDAMHFAEELSGRYRLNRRALAALAIADPGHLTCVSNDYGYEFVFSRYLEAHAKAGDCLLAISTSGASKNVLLAAKVARDLGVKVISLTGRTPSALGELADLDLCCPGGRFADRVQELHIKVIHILIELVERRFFPENYLS